MLTEALLSIRRAGQIILADDGSDFDVVETVAPILSLLRSEGADVMLIQSSPCSIDDRLTTPRVGKLVNTALEHVTLPYVTYLCDDDLFAAEWLPAVDAYFDTHEADDFIYGTWMSWQDGTPLESATVLFPTTLPLPPLTTGNFAHRTKCFREYGCRWDEETVAVHDAAFLVNLFENYAARGTPIYIPYINALAGWRREHKYNVARFVKPPKEALDAYADNAREILERRRLE
jgi:hypothetical protein